MFGALAGEFLGGALLVGVLLLVLRKLIAWSMDVELPRHPKRVFFSHQGYEMLWMSDPAGSDDPAVWQLLEDTAGPRLLARSFTDLLLAGARGEAPPV